MVEGSHTLYLVQHKDRRGWKVSALDHFLFDGLGFNDSRGALGDLYRDLIQPRHEGWRATGTEGFLRPEDAWAAYDAVRQRHPDREFRVVRRVLEQRTYVQHRMARDFVTANH